MQFLVLLAVLFSLQAQAANVVFKANAKQDSQESGQVTLGVIKVSADSLYEMPAGQLDDGTLIIKTSKAKTFAEAVKICSQLVPVGKWKIPSSMASNLWAASIDKSMAIETGDKNSGAIFPIWSYNDSQSEKDKAELSKKAIAYGIRGGEGFEPFEIDLSQKKVNRKGRDPLPRDLEKLLFDKLANGLTTYCELDPASLKATEPKAETRAQQPKQQNNHR